MEKKERLGIDIIIPIYNAYEDLVECIDSIRRHTDLTLDRLILINDNSSDERIKEYLDGLEDDDYIIIHNESNMGFSNNVNKGMSLSKDRDALLLNSDTVVTAHWVDKIYQCAYSDRAIGTVTPLSNNATLCSVPVTCADNELPEGLDADAMASLVETYSIKAYPRITVAVGFCMFIKREVIDTVGLFDAVTFEKGYGEENDFCNRAEQFGYYHVMCDDTFIYHKGSVSFRSEEKRELIERHEKILNERYEKQMQKNSIYCIENPDQYIRDNLNPHIDLCNGRKNILYMIHLDFRPDVKRALNSNIGGTQFHVKALTDELKYSYNVFVLSRDNEYIHLTAYTDDKIHMYKFYIGDSNEFFQFRNDHMKKLYGDILDYFRIDIVHVQHVDGLSLDMHYAASERGIPLIQTVHDFYAVTPAYKLLDAEGRYLDVDRDDERVWIESTHKYAGYADNLDIIPKWREEFGKAYGLCDKIVYPHEVTSETMLNYYPELKGKTEIIHHGTELGENAEIIIPKDKLIRSNDVVGCLDECEQIGNNGILLRGWLVLKNADSKDVNFYILTDEQGSDAVLQSMNKLERSDIQEHFKDKRYLYTGFSAVRYIGSKVRTVKLVLERDGKYYYSKRLNVKLEHREEKDKIRVAFLGGMVPEKGSRLAYDMISSAPEEEFEWYSIGIMGDKKLNALKQSNFYKTGTYTRDELRDIMKTCKIDIVCILSICPESFCYTLSESILCDTPVLVTDIGAIGYRVKKHGYGWCVDHNSSGREIVEKLREIFADRDQYEKVREIAKNHKEKTIHEMCQEYIGLYDKLNSDHASYGTADNRRFLAALEIDGEHVWSETPGYSALYKSYITTRDELTDVSNLLKGWLNSRSYASVRRISKLLHRN